MTRTTAGPSAPVQLHVLGRIELYRDEGEVERVLAQPKRLALLVYLALRRPRGFISRDELVGVFWPESTQSRARAALRQALRFLRSHLGKETIVNRGDAEVGISSRGLACDGARFMRALENGEDHEAVDAYGGELLPSFILSGAYQFDRWLQAERQTLRTSAVDAALRLADHAESEADLDGAAEHVRWALQREPTDEAVARRLISLLARTGNRSAATATYEALEARLANELELSPSPETAELAAAIRNAEGTLPNETRPLRSRSVSPRRVLVIALEDLTGNPALATVGRLAAEAVAQSLAAIAELEVVPPMATPGAPEWTSGEEPENETGDPELAASLLRLVERSGAGTVVGGTYLVEGDQLRLQARITDMVNRRLLQGPEPLTGPSSAPLELIETFSARVATALAPKLTSRITHVRHAARPPSIEAYSAYLEGLDRFILGDWREALARLQESSDLEPGYALPRIVQAIAHWNLVELPEARTVAMQAGQLRESLGRFERAVLDMVHGWLDGDWARAHGAARMQADLALGSIAHFQVAEEARRLNRPREAREILSRLDPEAGELKGWIFYWAELTEAHHRIGDHRRELELAHRCRRLHPDDPLAALLELRALAAAGHDDQVGRLLDEVLAVPGSREPDPGSLLRDAALELRAHGKSDAAQSLLEQSVAWYAERTGTAGAVRQQRDRARTLYHAGHLEAARAIFEELSRTSDHGVQPVGHHHGHLQAHLDEGYLGVIAVQLGDENERDRWARHLEGLQQPFLYGAHRFWLAAVAALEGDADRATVLMRRAFAEGLPYEHFLHTDPHLLRLRGHGSFDALMRPRG